MTDRQLLLVILAILAGTTVAAVDVYTQRQVGTPGRVLFDVGAVWALLYLGYLAGKGDR